MEINAIKLQFHPHYSCAFAPGMVFSFFIFGIRNAGQSSAFSQVLDVWDGMEYLPIGPRMAPLAQMVRTIIA